jgi:hypothetical protein
MCVPTESLLEFVSPGPMDAEGEPTIVKERWYHATQL